MFTYTTIQQTVQYELKEKGSKFIAHAFPIEKEADFKTVLSQIKTQYPDATHHCYAYKLFDNYRVNDDGEPKNSAGLPIYRQILSAGLDAVVVVVVRFYGGKKLGVSGLVNAYGASAAACLQLADKISKEPVITYFITCPVQVQYLVYEFCNFLQLSPEQVDQNLFKITIESNMTAKFHDVCAQFPNLKIYSENET